MKNTESRVYIILSAIFLFVSPHLLFGQCSPSAPAVAACSGTLVTNNANINSGTYYWPTGAPGTVSGLNFGGGTLRVCGMLTISSMNFSSGTIIVESGGSLTFSTSANLGGSIANRGNITVNGNLTMQGGAGTYFWNEANAVMLSISGTLSLNSGLFINKSYVNANSLVIQGGGICMTDNAIISVATLTNNTTNSVSYGGSLSDNACIQVTTSATLNNNLTNSSQIYVCKGSAVAASSGWGSATVFPNCTSCGIPLPLIITGFVAVNAGDKIVLRWTTSGDISTSEVFNVEESDDGLNFHSIAVVDVQQNINDYTVNDTRIAAAQQFYRIKDSFQNGAVAYSSVVMVKTDPSQQLVIFPNPVIQNNTVYIIISSPNSEAVQFSLIDLSGKIITAKSSMLNSGRNEQSLGLQNILPGCYILKIHSDHNGDVYGKIIVLP